MGHRGGQDRGEWHRVGAEAGLLWRARRDSPGVGARWAGSGSGGNHTWRSKGERPRPGTPSQPTRDVCVCVWGGGL